MTKSDMIFTIERETEALGFTLLTDTDQVRNAMTNLSNCTTLVLVNSLCRCSGSKARAALKTALTQIENKSITLLSVFDGVNDGAVKAFFSYVKPYPLSSPSIALFHKGELSLFLERHDIQSTAMTDLVENLSRVSSNFT